MVTISEELLDNQKKFRNKYEAFTRGDISQDDFKHYASAMGVYAQREPGTYMIRPRILSGVISADQLKHIRDISKEYSHGKIHLTTRQDVQFHKLRLEDVPDILDSLVKVNLISKGAGGNSVRNVACSFLSGVKESEAFDVTSHAEAVTEYLIGLDNMDHLPRKYKIAFSSSTGDLARATFSDLGFIAKTLDGKRGFSVFGGGGLGGSPSASLKIRILFLKMK